MQLNGKETGVQSLDKTVEQPRKLFIEMTRLEDVQAIRAVEFHPNGQYYAIGSNSKKLRICAYPKPEEFKTLRQEEQQLDFLVQQ